MANEGATVLTVAMTAHPTLVAQVQYFGNTSTLAGTITRAFIAGGPEGTRLSTEEGMVNTMIGAIRYLTSSEPEAWSTNGAIIGQVVKVLYYGMSDWSVADRYRVVSRKEVAGAVRLGLVAEYE